MVDKYKCEVTANRLVMEVLDDDGNPVVVTKKDTFGQPYQETAEVQYRRGAIIFLPDSAIQPRLSSLKLVLEPVKIAPVLESKSADKDDPESAESEDLPDTNSTKDNEEVTVSDLIPKDKSKAPEEKPKTAAEKAKVAPEKAKATADKGT